MYVYIHMCIHSPLPWHIYRGCRRVGERGRSPKEVGTLRYLLILSETLPVMCPSVQWQADGLTIHTEKWFLGAGFLGAPPISLKAAGIEGFSKPRAQTAANTTHISA